MRLEKSEKETIIRFDEATSQAEVYTYDYALKLKLKTMSDRCPDVVEFGGEDSGGAVFYLPKKYVKISLPRTIE